MSRQSKAPKPATPRGPIYGGKLDMEEMAIALGGLLGTTPEQAVRIFAVAEVRHKHRQDDPKSRAARSRQVYDQIHASLARDGLLTGNAAADAELVFDRESGHGLGKQEAASA